MTEISEKQKLFCRNLAKGMNQTEAAIKAGYEESRAAITASELVRKSNVAAYIAKLSEKAESKAIMSIEQRQEWLTGIIHNEEEKLADRLKAVDILNKMNAAYLERRELTITDPIVIHDDIEDE